MISMLINIKGLDSIKNVHGVLVLCILSDNALHLYSQTSMARTPLGP